MKVTEGSHDISSHLANVGIVLDKFQEFLQRNQNYHHQDDSTHEGTGGERGSNLSRSQEGVLPILVIFVHLLLPSVLIVLSSLSNTGNNELDLGELHAFSVEK